MVLITFLPHSHFKKKCPHFQISVRCSRNCGRGGSNGLDGKGHYEGKGTNRRCHTRYYRESLNIKCIDVAAFPLEHHELSPGAAGLGNTSGGGGGGGVLVNSIGPVSGNGHGKGFGGGGGGSDHSGLPGMILIEIKQK